MFGVDDAVKEGFSFAREIVKRVWPDPQQQSEALFKISELQEKGDLAFLEANVQLMKGQMEINAIEAQHGGDFKGGWRPFIGWTCGIAMAVKFVVVPSLVTVVVMLAWAADCISVGAYLPFPMADLPEISWAELSVPLMGMLGLGGLRTLEKIRSERSIRGS